MHDWTQFFAVAVMCSTTALGPVVLSLCRKKWITWDAFLSHNWSTPRWKTFLALCLHYNARVAFVAAVLAGVLVSVGIALTLFPLVEMTGTLQGSAPQAPYATVVVPLVFMVVVHCAHEVLPHSQRIFLDKLCIHQTDEVKKSEGIAHLGLTMFFSSAMVVLDSDVYFKRLWTVYELASCLVVDSTKLVVFLPVNLPATLHGLSSVVCIGLVVLFLCSTSWVDELFPSLNSVPIELRLFVLLCPSFAIATVIMRRWAREQARRKARLQSFSIRNAECSDESDRKLVHADIVNLLDVQLLATGTSSDRALEVFDDVVRMTMPQAMDKSSLRFVHCVVLGLALLGRGFDRLGADIVAGAAPRFAALNYCRSAFQCIFFMPEVAWLLEACTKRCLHLTGITEGLYLLTVLSVALFFTRVLDAMNLWLILEAHENDVMVGAFVAVMVLQTALVFGLFREQRRSTSRPHRVSCQESKEAVRKFRFGGSLASSLQPPPAAPPSIPDEETASPTLSRNIERVMVDWINANEPSMATKQIKRERI